MTAPVPEEDNAALDLTEQPPGEHGDDLPDGGDAGASSQADQLDAEQAENAESSQDQPSQ